jgi:hypothetical protein
MKRVDRWLRLTLIAIGVGLSIAWMVWTVNGFTLADAEGYRMAADRLREGQALYPAVADPGAASVFRYAPWFAVAWIPVAALPVALGNALWAAALFVASIAAVLPLARQRTPAASLGALLGASVLAWTAARGNVHPLVMVALVHGLNRRSGPIWIALAASLKAVPILFVLVYVARREWSRAAVAIGLTLVLVAPMPFLGWTPDTANVGASLSLWSLASPLVWLLTAAIGLALALIVARSAPGHAALASSAAAILALPRLLLYDLSYLLVPASIAPSERPARAASRQASGSAPTATISR